MPSSKTSASGLFHRLSSSRRFALYEKKRFFAEHRFERVAGKGDFAGGDLANFWGPETAIYYPPRWVKLNAYAPSASRGFCPCCPSAHIIPILRRMIISSRRRKPQNGPPCVILDDILGVFVEELRARGVLEDTLVILLRTNRTVF